MKPLRALRLGDVLRLGERDRQANVRNARHTLTTRKNPCADCVPTRLNSASMPVSKHLRRKAARRERPRNRIIIEPRSPSGNFRITQLNILKYLKFHDFEPVGREFESLRAHFFRSQRTRCAAAPFVAARAPSDPGGVSWFKLVKSGPTQPAARYAVTKATISST